MKILHIEGYYWDGNWFTDRNHNIKLYETPEFIYINDQPHTKDTLSPVFGKDFAIYNEYEQIFFENSLGNANSSPREGASNRNVYPWNNGPVRFHSAMFNNGQYALLNEKTYKKFWQSSFEPNYYYVWSMSDSLSMWLYKIDKNTNEIVKRKNWSGDFYDGNWPIFHEDEDYLYGYADTNNITPSSNAHGYRFYMLDKKTWALDWGGLSYYYKSSQMIHMNDKNLTYVTEGRNSSSGAWFTVHKSAWKDARYHGNSDSWKEGNPDTWRYTRLKMSRKNEESGEYEPAPYHLGGGAGYDLFSDNETYDALNGVYLKYGSAIVHDYRNEAKDSLRKTYEIARWYMPFIDTEYNFQIMRFNVSISDDDVVPAYDVRKCRVSNPKNLELPRWTDESWGEGGTLSSNQHGRHSAMLAYFSSEDENHHYMILSGESQTNQALHTQSDDFARKMYVYKIKNHLDSIVDDIHENTSRELELIQVIKESGCPMGLLRPNHDPKTFIHVKSRGTNQTVYNWNQTKEEFEKIDTIHNGETLEAGVDSEGRIYFVDYPSTYNLEIHMYTLNLPSTIFIETEKDSYEFNGSPITSFVNVSAYNYMGERIEMEVDLQIVGSGVEFDGSLSKTTITTLTGDHKPVPITITSGAVVQINASVGFSDSGDNLTTFSLDNNNPSEETETTIINDTKFSITEQPTETVEENASFVNPPYKIMHNGFDFFLISQNTDYIKYQCIDDQNKIHTIFFQNNNEGTLNSVSNDDNDVFFVGVGNLREFVESGNCEYNQM